MDKKYEVLIHKQARKKFERLEVQLKDRFKEIFKLLSNPFDLDIVKIKGSKDEYRIRVGKYRVLIIIQEKTVYIVDFDTRGKIYKTK